MAEIGCCALQRLCDGIAPNDTGSHAMLCNVRNVARVFAARWNAECDETAKRGTLSKAGWIATNRATKKGHHRSPHVDAKCVRVCVKKGEVSKQPATLHGQQLKGREAA
jgi:hypothetical protein